MAAHRLGIEDVPVMVAAGWSEAKKRAYMLADNKLTLNGEWDLDRLAIEIAELRASDFDISLIGFSESEIDDLLKADEDGAGPGAGSLAERFMISPFSVLSARGGWWQERKAAWLALGIQSELGRGIRAGDKLAMSETVQRLKPSADQAAKHGRARPTAEPGGSKMPAADYRKTHARGDGRRRAIDPQG
jgi:ParB-like chromosome segregation protein Spo0J